MLVGSTVMLDSLLPIFHEKLSAPEAVMVVLAPLQMASSVVVSVMLGEVSTLISIEAVTLHPAPFVPVTE